jgi:hypothetical protein
VHVVSIQIHKHTAPNSQQVMQCAVEFKRAEKIYMFGDFFKNMMYLNHPYYDSIIHINFQSIPVSFICVDSLNKCFSPNVYLT